MSDEDWNSLRIEAETIFTPGTAIKQEELFAGRADQINKLAQRIRLAGSHAVIYGERGVGKSSLVNIFRHIADKSPNRVQYIRIAATSGDSFSDVMYKIFKRLKVTYSDNNDERSVAELYEGKKITPDDVLLELENFSDTATPIIVIDEFDRISSNEEKALVSEMIKNVSDESLNVTFFIVGISDAVGDLLTGHESIGRAIAEVEMPRMSDEEIIEVIQEKRLSRIGFDISDSALWKCVFVCKGLPHYAHLIGLHAMQAACDRKSILVDQQDIDTATSRALDGANQSIKEGYDKAISSERTNNIFKEVLACCALAEKDVLGRFSAKSVSKLLSEITGKQYDVPAFSYHLDQFCESSRGCLLEKIGKTRLFKFRFTEALMEPYVILESLRQGIVNENHIKKFSPQRQKDLFSSI